MTGRFARKTALVTGAGRGIGEHIARALAEEGAAVIVADLDGAAAVQVAEQLSADGADVYAFQMDTSDPQQARAAVAHAVDEFGGLHLAVNNAAIGGGYGLAGDVDIAEWQKIIDVNLSGVFYGLRYQIPALLEAGGGSIVNISSVLGLSANSTSVPYTAAKHGVTGLTKAAALGYADRDVRVNSVHPGYIATPSLAVKLGKAYDELPALHPMGRLGSPAEVTAVVLFLLSDAARFVTGAQYAVDGGYLAR